MEISLTKSEKVMDDHRDKIENTLSQSQEGTSENLTNSVDEHVSETVIIVRKGEDACVSGDTENSEVKIAKAALESSSKVLVEELKIEGKEKEKEKEKNSCVIDVKCGNGEFGEKWDEEKVCRICHLVSDQSAESSTELVQLGCGCKDELGVAHIHCAEAWFKLRGNRLCEICGKTAKNVTGVGDNRFMEEWNEARYVASNSNPSDRCWRGRPFCNFVMACLVVAFVLPWFFRVNMF